MGVDRRSGSRPEERSSNPAGRFTIRPIDKTKARIFVNIHHRHNEAPTEQQVTLVTALYRDDELVGVGTAGRPVALGMCDGYTIEINRVCVSEFVPNANSQIYGALCRAAKALGYKLAITYTLHSESGASLKAAGFTLAADIGARSWMLQGGRSKPRYDENLFGERRNAAGEAKYRWERQL